MKSRDIEVDADELFKKLNIPSIQNNNNFEVWEVTPLKKGMKIFFESC